MLKPPSNQATKFYMLTQARFWTAMLLTWACGTKVYAPRIASKCSFTDLGKMELAFGFGLLCHQRDLNQGERTLQIRNIAP